MTAIRRHGAAIATLVLFSATSACGGGTDADGSRLSLLARDATVAPFEVAEVVVRGATLTEDSYPATLGATALTVSRATDSTLAFLVPEVPAGALRLSVTIGTRVADVGFSIGAPTAIGDPVAYTRGVDAMFESRLAAEEAELAAASGFGADATQLAADIALARASFASARAAFDAMAPDEQREAANILRATYGMSAGPATQGALASVASAADLCGDPDIPLTVEEAEQCEAASTSKLTGALDAVKELFSPNPYDCEQAADAAALRGIRASIRTFLWHVVNGCHYARYSQWSYETSQASAFPTTPEFEESSSPEIRGLRASLAAVAPRRFTFGAPATFTPTIAFRPMIASDIGRVPAATTKAALFRDLKAAWTRINTILPSALRLAPVTLESVGSAPARPLRYPASRLRLGSITPATVTGTATTSSGNWTVTFNASDRTHEIPFTFKVIYDGGRYGSDTLLVPATLGDSVPVYEAAALGRWTVTRVPANGDNWDTYWVVLTAEYNEFTASTRKGVYQETPMAGSSPCPWTGWHLVGAYCEYPLNWNVYARDGRYVLGAAAQGSSFDQTATPLTMPITGYSTSTERWVKD
jgi:hypothetical protein